MSAREKIFDAAIALAVREGVTGLGVERVVREAKLSKGAFFYHFQTKEEMIRGLLEYVAATRIEAVDAAVANGSRFTDALVAMLIDDVKKRSALIHVLVASVAIDPTLRKTLTERRERWRLRMIEEDGIRKGDADLLCLAIDGLMIAAVLYERSGSDNDQNRAIRAVKSLAKRIS